ncbi:MAG: NAD(P)H-binding protein, partial [Armatimonadetes bacterium]|nr:NAD(P)H-binding protein [Armatimonadota bacterium]
MSEDRSGEAGECKVAAVTGAFGYSGKYIARRLLDRGYRVVNLTGHPDRPDPFDGEVEVAGRRFDDPDSLARSMEGAAVLFNTYWVRFARGGETFEKAVENSVTLFHAAKKAGVRRVVHTSIANPSEDSPLGYYRGKALVEKALQDSGLSHAILRPTVIFGKEDILINNIAWSLRKLPFFAIPGDGSYKIQPVFVEDFADLAIQAAESEESTVQDAVGPEVFTFDKLVRLVAGAIGRPYYVGLRLPRGAAPVGDIAGHVERVAYALRLDAPHRVSAAGSEVEGDGFPADFMVTAKYAE